MRAYSTNQDIDIEMREQNRSQNTYMDNLMKNESVRQAFNYGTSVASKQRQMESEKDDYSFVPN